MVNMNTKKSTDILWGTDPELFAVYQKNAVKFALPPYFFRKVLGVQASDDEKHPVFLENETWKLHEDGAAFEMAIHPSKNPRELFDNIHLCKLAAETTILKKFPEHVEPELQFLPTVGFEIERWKDEGDDFRMSTRFGCDPDRDAYNFDVESRDEDASAHPFRYGGGHIHWSGSKLSEEEPILATKCMSMSAGLAAILYSDTPNLDKRRTYMYGKPGKYRIQRYGKNNPFGEEYANGMEYRTPSNRWASNWEIASKVFEWAEIGIRSLLEGGLGKVLLEEISQEVCDAIVQADQKVAGQLLGYIETKV